MIENNFLYLRNLITSIVLSLYDSTYIIFISLGNDEAEIEMFSLLMVELEWSVTDIDMETTAYAFPGFLIYWKSTGEATTITLNTHIELMIADVEGEAFTERCSFEGE